MCVPLAEKTERELVGVRNDYEKMVREKDSAIETLTHKVNTMCVQYETLFHVSRVFLSSSYCCRNAF